jgi:acylphosphatase
MTRRAAAPAWVEFADTLPQRAASLHASRSLAGAQSRRSWGAERGDIAAVVGRNRYIRRVICKKCLVSGRVQGVFYRGAAAQRARELGVRGHAHNLPDGRVEVLACGPEEAVRKFVSWLWIGSSAAKVSAVETSDVPAHAAPAGFHTA